MMSKYIKVIPTVLGSICIIVLLILGLQNCNPYVSNSINDGHSVLNPSNLTTNSVYKSFYANWVNSVEDINCANMANINLTDAEFQYIKNSESQFSHNRYMIIHPQPVDFTGNLSHFQEISSQFANVGTSFKPATSMTYFAFEERDLCAFKKKIKKAFKYSVEYNLPLLIHIDFEWFIDNRLDIWNWYLPSQEGYNVNNKFKVEWSNWNTPIKKFGIFWDEAGLPRKARLCYSNPSVQLEVVQKGRFIASIINEWRLELAKMNKSYLFVGIDPGWETGIQNYSNYAPAKNIGVNYNMGYCALHYEGYSEKNPPADPEAALIEVVRKYVDLESQIFFEKGIPKNKIFTHIAAMGGDKVLGVHPNAPFHQRSPIELAFNDYSTPGLSLYPNVYFTDSIINKVKGHDWSIIETAYSNFEHLSVFAGDPNLKSINIYSWDLIKREGQIPNVINLMNFPINYGAIEGWIDGVSLSNGKHYLSGWACSKGYGQAVGLHVYANGPHPNGTVLTTSEKTNISAEQGIASVCLLGPGKPLRFSIEIPSHIKQNYGGQSIFIYGIHPSGVGSQNKLLGNSGAVAIPLASKPVVQTQVPPQSNQPLEESAGEIIGWIDGVSLSNGKHYLSGWACSKGYGQAVGLHVYANGPHPNGTVLTTSEKTNISAEQGIASVCLLGPGKPLRFSIEIPSHIKQNYGGQSIFIYGIHPSGVGSQNKLLGNSGNLKIPNL